MNQIEANRTSYDAPVLALAHTNINKVLRDAMRDTDIEYVRAMQDPERRTALIRFLRLRGLL